MPRRHRHPGLNCFRGSIPRLYAPLPTLRRRPRGRLRTDRGRRGLLLLHRSGLSPHPPCQSPGALTRVTACTLALSPIRDTHSEGFSYFVTSIAAPAASGWSDCRVGLAPTGKRRLVTAHTQIRHRGESEKVSSAVAVSCDLLLPDIAKPKVPK